MLLLGTPFFLNHGASQYADIELAYFIAAGTLLFCLYDAGGQAQHGLAALGGLSAGLASCTKNEGLLFVAVIAGSRVFLAFAGGRFRRADPELGAAAAGAAVGLVSLAVFKLMSGVPAGGPVFVVLGFVAGWTPVAVPGLPTGCYQNTDVVSSVLAIAGTGTTRGPTCAGYANVPLALPNNTAFQGLSLAAQALALDAGSSAPLPFVGSNAQRVTLY